MANSNNGRAIRNRTLMLVQTAILAAIMVVLHFSGWGYIKIGFFELTIMTVPMIIGAIVVGKYAGLILGGLFGVSVLFTGSGQFFLSINPVLTVILCVVFKGLLLGFLCGIMFRAFKRIDKTKLWSFGVTGLITSILNTVITLGGIALFFGSNTKVQEAFEITQGTNQGRFFIIVISAAAVNALIEAGLCTFITFAISKPVSIYIKEVN